MGHYRVLLSLLILFSQMLFAQSTSPLVDSIYSTLTPRARAGQMILVYNSPLSFLESSGVGGVLIMGGMLRKPELLSQNLLVAQETLPIPLLVSIDQEGGLINRLSRIEKWKNAPSAQEMSTWESDSITTYQSAVALDLIDLGINLNLAPVLDPYTNELDETTHIGNEKRSFGTGVEEIVKPAIAFAEGFTQNNVGCVIKHFPGYNIKENSDKNVSVSNADSSEIYAFMQPFFAFRTGATAVMMASVLYEKVCDKPAVFCSDIVEQARKIDPNILVMTDDLWGTAVRSFTYPNKEITTKSYPDSAFARVVELSVLAGNDVLMITYPQKVELMITTIMRMAKEDPSVAHHVEEAVKRILYQKEKLGLFDGDKN